MDAQLDLSLLATVKDPELRAAIARLGNAMAEALPEPTRAPEPSSTAKVIQFPLFPEATRPVSNDMARIVRCFLASRGRIAVSSRTRCWRRLTAWKSVLQASN